MTVACLCATPLVALACLWPSPSIGSLQDPAKAAAKPKTPLEPQPRKAEEKVKVNPSTISVDDGDTVTIKWGDDEEIVRILGIDTPETTHLAHNIPIDQPYGREARAFAQGAFSTASEVELLRCKSLDPYKRTLGYLFINGKNYSLLVIKARLAEESITPFGDNGFPEIAAEVKAAAKAAGPLPFESPNLFRRRMRPLSDWMKSQPAGE